MNQALVASAVIISVVLSVNICRAGSPGSDHTSGSDDARRVADLGAGSAGGLPKLGFRRDQKQPFLTMITIDFPDVPGSTCEAWCYETLPRLEFLGWRKLEGGGLGLRHRVPDSPVLIITTARPEPGAVEFVAQAVVNRQGDSDAKLPDPLPPVDMCVQFKRGENFRSQPDPFLDWVKRCFIYTDGGRTFLNRTTRRDLVYRTKPPLPPDPRASGSPWIQTYVGVWQLPPRPEEIPRGFWSNYSPDRFVIPIIGLVSRDDKYLAALANGSAGKMCQGWIDCLHNYPGWLPVDAPPARRRWRQKLYLMPNDPKALLDRVTNDFPEATRLKENRVPARQPAMP